MSFDLGKFRPCEETYNPYLMSDIPLLKRKFTGNFDWLSGANTKKSTTTEELDNLQKKFKMVFPKDYYLFKSHPDWEKLLTESTTASFIPEKIEVQPFLSGFLTPIYYDQQGIVLWYLYFESDAKKCKDSIVLSTAKHPKQIAKLSARSIQDQIISTCETFESFLYRIELENQLWQKLNNKNYKIPATLSKDADEYLSFYDQEKWKKFFSKESEEKIKKNFQNYDPVLLAQYKELSGDFMLKFAYKLPWVYLSRYQKLNDTLIEKFANKLDWFVMVKYQKLSENIIRKFKDKLDMPYVAYYQKISPELKKELKI